jgi:tetratricopeptide (TPR) repeat protein
LLQDAAVLGKVFWLGGLVNGRSRETAEKQLHVLERKGFVHRATRSSVADEAEYAFSHLLVREVAYGQIPRAERVGKHRVAARWIESLGRSEDHAETLAHHYTQALTLASASGQPTDELAERGRLALRDAGDRAKALNAFDAAAEFYESALRLWPDDDPERPRIVLTHSETEMIRRGRVGDDLEEAVDHLIALGDHERAAIALILLAEEQWQAGRRDGADAHLERALTLLEDLPPSGAKARVLSEASRYHMLADRNEEGLRISREALAMATELGLDDVRVHALNYMSGSRIGLGDDGGIEDMERSVALANEIGSIESLRSYNNLFATLGNLGLLDRAAEAVSAGLRAAERFGAPRGASLWLRYERVNVSYWQGRWEDVLRYVDEIFTEVGPVHALSRWAHEARGRVRLARDDEAGAIDDAMKSLELAREAKDPQTLHPALAFAAFAFASVDRDRDAEPLVDELLALDVAGLRQVPAASPVFDLVWVVSALGRSAELLHGLEHTNVPSPWTEAAAEIARGEYDRAADIYSEMGMVPNEAYTRLRAAEHLVREGRRAEADEQLTRALAFYRSVRATRYIREGEALLAASA